MMQHESNSPKYFQDLEPKLLATFAATSIEVGGALESQQETWSTWILCEFLLCGFLL